MILNNKTLQLIYLSIFFILSCVALYFRFEAYDLVGVNTFSIRDIDRAFNLIDGNYIPLAGPELINGGRTPGPFFYFLLAIPLLFKYSYESVYCFNLILNLVSIGIFVYTVKKFIGPSASLITLAFLSLNMPHVGAVMHPQNPSFLMIFSALFFWCLLELVINKKYFYLSIIICLVSLALQIHFSFALYYAVCIIVPLVLRIKFPFKHKIISCFVLLTCFAPYLRYRLLTYIPESYPNASTFLGQIDFSIIGLLKFITAQNVISRLTFNAGLGDSIYWIKYSNEFATILYFLTNFALFYFLFIAVSKTIKTGFRSCQLEWVILLLFYVPAITLEIVNKAQHFNRYNYVLLFPQLLLLSTFFYQISLFKLPVGTNSTNSNISTDNKMSGFHVKDHIFESFVYIVLLVGFLYFGYYADKMILQAKNQNTLYSSSANQELLLTKLMQQLNLSGTEFYNNVYHEGLIFGRIASKKRLELISLKNGFKPTGNKNCYFIFDPKLVAGNTVIKQRINDFLLKDETIKLETRGSKPLSHKILFKEQGFKNEEIVIYKYNPGSHSCYANSIGPWEKEGQELSLMSKGFGYSNALETKVISYEEKYKLDQSLQFLKGNYVIFDKQIQQSFRMTITIESKATNYHISAEIFRYAEFGVKKKNFSELSLIVATSDLNTFLSVHKIITPKMFYTADNVTGLDFFKNSFTVSKSFFLKKNQFALILKWVSYNKNMYSAWALAEEFRFNKLVLNKNLIKAEVEG